MSEDSTLRLWVVTSNYPSAALPQRGTFVRALLRQLVDRGVRSAVIAPRRLGQEDAAGLPDDSELGVVRPPFVSLSNKRIAGSYSTFRWTVASFGAAVARAARQLPFSPELCYGHFLFPGGAAALREARRRGVPAVVALGESQLDHYAAQLGRRRTRETLLALDGILSVSAENRDYCVRELGIPSERCVVIENSADANTFNPRERAAARRELNLDPERPIVAYCGHFIERKGPLRVLRAIEAVPEAGAVFLGEGPQKPSGEQVLFAGRVPHDQVPLWLSAADLFVMPTLAEGSPNAIAEAMACSLPVVASDIPAVREKVDDDFAILVDPSDEAAIGAAIASLVADPERRSRMSQAALARFRRFTLDDRADQVLAWLTQIARA